ncbi:MAG TPA: flagellar protein FlaG [Casimicrobiaceae bacterium]
MLVGDLTNVVAFPGPASASAERGAGGASAAGAGSGRAGAAAASLSQIQAAILDANNALRAMNREIQFELDPASGRLVTRLIDTSDNQVLRQIPSEEMLHIAEALDRVQGLLIERHA